jgi:hypothetical protein
MKKYFNMIDITLAIGIVALGLVGILSLFPVGFQSVRDAVGDNYVNDASQLFLSYIKLIAKEDTSAVETPPTPEVPPTQTQIDAQWTVATDAILQTKPDAPNPIVDTTNPSLLTGGWIVTEVPGLYRCGTPGLYRIYQGNSGVNDFKAGVRIWKTRTVTSILRSGAWVPDSPQYNAVSPAPSSCGLNIEFSWPIEKPYDKRTKRFFYFELFRTQL